MIIGFIFQPKTTFFYFIF